MDIHVFWDGPWEFPQFDSLSNSKDYGVYQIYGLHPIYGDSVLLYVGKAVAQRFSTRLRQHEWLKTGYKEDELKVYIGRLAGRMKVTDEEWEDRIGLAEELLIHSHQPVYNIRNKQTINEERIMNVHVFNWGASKKLFPEVSGRRFTSKFDHISEEHIYRCEDNE